MARFHTPDPLAQNFSFQSPYIYAANNPVRFIDYMGLYAEDSFVGADGLTNEQWVLSSSPESDYCADTFRRYNRQQDMFRYRTSGMVNKVATALDNNDIATLASMGLSGFYTSVDGEIRNIYVYTSSLNNLFNNIFSGWGSHVTNQGGNSLYMIGMGMNAAGFIANAGEYSNVIYGSWRGANGIWYPTTWGGNQWTGARSTVLSRAGAFKLAGRGFFVVGTGISLYQGGDAFLQGDYTGAAKAGLDISMGAIATFGGPPGWVIGGGYFLLDAFGAFDRPVFTTTYRPPSYAMPDKTYVAPTIIIP